jgi:hypothetical protein
VKKVELTPVELRMILFFKEPVKTMLNMVEQVKQQEQL